MRAVAIDDFGAAPALVNLPTPQPGAGEVLVRVRDVHLAGDGTQVADLLSPGGQLRVPITRTYALHEVPKAFADLAAGTLGKFAVTVLAANARPPAGRWSGRS